MKIPCVVLVFHHTPGILMTLGTLRNKNLDIYVVENKSPNTPEIKEHCLDMLKEGEIKKYILFEDNIAQNAIGKVFEDNLIPFDGDYFIYTDGDLIPDYGWLEEHLNALNKHKNLFCIATDLKTDNLPLLSFPESSNWVPSPVSDQGDYFEGYSGGHLLTFRSNEFQNMLQWMKGQGYPFIDTHMHQYANNNNMKWGKSKYAKSEHWTWTLYQDRSHPYTKFKLDNQNIWTNKLDSKYEVFE